MSEQILPGLQRYNKAEEAILKKHKRFAAADASFERPQSGRSDATRNTGALTKGFT